MRLVLFDTQSRVCVFDRTWQDWRGDTSSGALCRLVFAFSQLGRDLGGNGTVSGVHFHDSIDAGKKRFKHRFETLGRSPNRSKRGPSSPRIEADALDLVCSTDTTVGLTCALFHEKDMLTETAEELVQQTLVSFKSEMKGQISALSPLFEAVNAKPDDPYDENNAIEACKSFEATCTSLFRNHVE